VAFDRLVEVIVGPDGGTGVKITQDLHIVFEVRKSIKETVNHATATIHNLSKDTVGKMTKAGDALIIRAGYKDEGGAKGLFFGHIVKSQITKEGTSSALILEGTDGGAAMKTQYASVSYAPGTTNTAIVKDLLDILGIPVGNQYTLPSKEYANGYVFVGKAAKSLEEVLARVQYKYTIQNNQIYILGVDDAFEQQGLKLTYESGLLQVPEPLVDATEEKKPTTAPTRFKIRSLLFPQIVPGALITIDAAPAVGTFKVEVATFSGDTQNGEFSVEAEVREAK